MLQPLHHCPVLSIALDTTQGWLYANWQNVRSLTEVQHGCGTILDYVKQEHCSQILNDNRQVCTLWAESAEWVGRIFLPQLDAAGVRQLAWINAHSIYGRLSTSQAVAYAERPQTRLFEDYDEAVAWLRAEA